MRFDVYEVEIEFLERVVGGIPVVPEGAERADAYEAWARGQDVDPKDARELAEKLAEDPDMPVAVEEVEGLETGFRRDDDGLYIEARQVKAMIREAAQRLGYIKGVRGTRQVVQHDLHVRSADGSQRLRLLDDSESVIAEPTGKESRPISVVTRQGPRTAIKRFEFVEVPILKFRVHVLAGGIGEGIVGLSELAEIMEFGGWIGLGADRSQGEGTFMVRSLTQLDTGEAE